LIPPIENFTFRDWHRLVPAEFRPKNVFREVATSEQAEDWELLASATGSSPQQYSTGASGISHRELVYGIPNAEMVRNAFRHPGKGARFHDSTRGAWYAANHEQVSVQEVGYHLVRRLKTARGIQVQQVGFQYHDWQADFHADFYHLTTAKKYAKYLQPEPIPQCYAAGQELARTLLLKGGNGIVYPSVRFGEGSLCVACFRPALVYRPRLTDTYTLMVTVESNGGYQVTFKKQK
jgi:hypothetical protein